MMNAVLIAVWKFEITLSGVSWQWSWIANNECNGASKVNNMKIVLFDKRVSCWDLGGVWQLYWEFE